MYKLYKSLKLGSLFGKGKNCAQIGAHSGLIGCTRNTVLNRNTNRLTKISLLFIALSL